MQEYKVVTFTHKTTHLHTLRDYLVNDVEDGAYPAKSLHQLKLRLGFKEILYLNTCNRVTFFFTTDEEVDEDYVTRLMQAINPLFNMDSARMHAQRALIFQGMQAIRHLFSVSASLDSLVLGEREILGQLKLAFHKARENQLSGDAIRLAIENCVLFAKKIYSETRIGEKPVSVVSLAFRELANRGISPDARLFMVGAGQTNHLMANLLVKYGFRDVHVFNRSLENAQELAARFSKGVAHNLSEMADIKERPDFVITCTGSASSVIDEKHLSAWGIEPAVPFTVVDLAVPADLDTSVRKKYAIDYIDVASLKEQAEQNMEFRRREVTKAYQLLDAFCTEFENKYKERKLELALMEIPNQVKALRQKAVQEVFSKDIATLDDEAREVLEKVMEYMEKKYISIPMVAVKKTLLN
jgi:glutamyl-tRNA reductase